jgi:hypothetical protein
MSLARRIAEQFVAPADGHAAHDRRTGAGGRERRADAGTPAGGPPVRAGAVASPRMHASVALLAPAGDAPALAAALALALARRERAAGAVVCVWSPASARALWRAPALPAAARLARTLAARGHAARGSGRLVVVELAASCEEAAAEALRVTAAAGAAGAAPTVIALAGPRAAAFDALLESQDLVVVAVAPGADPALARLAVAGLRRAVACEVPPPHPGRALAAAGVALLPAARRAVTVPVEALP